MFIVVFYYGLVVWDWMPRVYSNEINSSEFG